MRHHAGKSVEQTLDLRLHVELLCELLLCLHEIILLPLPGVGIKLMVFHELEVMGSPMVSRQEQQVVTLSHLVVERLQQTGNVLIEFKISFVGMSTTSTPLMTNYVGL